MAKHYQNPVVMYDPKRWSEKAQLRFAKFNVLVNFILPVRLLHLLDASKSSRDYRAAQKSWAKKIEGKNK
jgi:hypothetical protein